MDYWGLKEKKGIVLDFDGTICHLFSGFDLQSTINYLKIKLDPLLAPGGKGHSGPGRKGQ